MQEVIELKMQLTEAHDKLKKLEGRTRVTESDDPLQYVKSARTKLRKITPGGVQGKAPVKIDIDTEEVTELLSLLEDESEAAALCSESGLDLGNGDVSLETMKAALRGYFSKGLSVRHVFDELDVDDSGYLDQDEVEQAIAMLGFLTDDVAKVMDEMDPNGDGEVSFEEFQAWWKINMEDSTSDSAAEQGGGDAAMQEELLNLRRQLEAAVARGGGPPGGQDELDSGIVAATSERLQAAEAAEADARSQLAVMRKQLEEVKAKLAAVEAKDGAGAATEKQEKVMEPRAKLDAADSAVAEASGVHHLCVTCA
jgi:Ca2+-binding EF-hand superfamily protein